MFHVIFVDTLSNLGEKVNVSLYKKSTFQIVIIFFALTLDLQHKWSEHEWWIWKPAKLSPKKVTLQKLDSF